MKKNYVSKKLLVISVSLLLLFIASCKKDNGNNNNKAVNIASPKKLGFYEVDSSIYRILLMNISQIGNTPTNFDLIFDTGSGGMVVDAQGVLPASMITSTGFNFTGDSTVVNGITLTNQASIIEYGDDNATSSKVYGNLAYASVTVGDNNGNIVVKRLPFFIYYKAIDSKGVVQPAHDFDVFGVSPEYDITFSNGAYITSPFSFYDPGAGLTKGFKMDALGTTNFSLNGTYVAAITLGLTAADLTSNGFNLIQLPFVSGEGYLPIIPGSIGLVNDNVTAEMLFDTGTEPYSYIEDPHAPTQMSTLQPNNHVSLSTSTGFTWSYDVSATDNLTVVENPSTSGSNVTVISLDFFLYNEYLLDFANHQLGLKSN